MERKPKMKELYNYQKNAVSSLKDQPVSMLAFDMGLGKTLTATEIIKS